ncbi:MAG: hypothetical protein WAQ27_05675 [Candidatus Microsaccharimonas sp.]
MQVIEPLSDHIEIDPLPERPPVPVTPSAAAPNAPNLGPNPAAPIQPTVVNPGAPAPYQLPPEPVDTQAAKIMLRQKIAAIVIVTIGSIVLGSALLYIAGLVFVQYFGYLYLVYAVQAAIGLGLIFRKELFRWLLLIFAVVSLVINIYFAFIQGLFLISFTGNGAFALLALIGVGLRLIVPLGIIIVLNLPSVKNSFN